MELIVISLIGATLLLVGHLGVLLFARAGELRRARTMRR